MDRTRPKRSAVLAAAITAEDMPAGIGRRS
jgi:hypothetical protein